MSDSRRVRLLLTDQTSEVDVARVAGLLHCSLASLSPETPAGRERIWVTEDGTTFLSYVEDRAIGLRYLSLQGKDAEQLAERIEKIVPIVTPESVYAMLHGATSRDEWITAIYHAAAVSSGDLDRGLLAGFQKAMMHPDADVRKAALFAASYPGWEELREPLERMRDSDPDHSVRVMAGMTLNALEQNVWSKR